MRETLGINLVRFSKYYHNHRYAFGFDDRRYHADIRQEVQT